MVSTRPKLERSTDYRIFNRRDAIACGWYWLLPASAVKIGSVHPVNVAGYELAVFRGADGVVAALDAYCPHMGAHLAEGRVEGNQLRCFFHNWCFDKSGACTDIPCLGDKPQPKVATRSWPTREMHGLIWVWIGDDEPDAMPEPPELAGMKYQASLGNKFVKNCHPNVVLINAIDEQHFATVHHLPGHILRLQDSNVSRHHIRFENTGRMPTRHVLGRLLAPFYKGSLTYDLDYFSGTTGTVVFGPDFLHLYLMFALRLTPDGKTEGITVAFTPERKSWLGTLLNPLIQLATKLGGLYFALGDTRVFQTIRFNLATPIAADRTVMAFICHLENQESFPCSI